VAAHFLGDYALAHASELYLPPAAESGKRVGIVGAGPAGLTAAYFLRQAGYQVLGLTGDHSQMNALHHGLQEERREVVREALIAIGDTRPPRENTCIQAMSFPAILVAQIYLNNAIAPFNNVKLRQAMKASFDTQSIIDGVLGGMGVATDSQGPTSAVGYAPANGDIKFDLNHAKALLTAAGLRAQRQGAARERPLRGAARLERAPLRRRDVAVALGPGLA
jgi:hypothetical protein